MRLLVPLAVELVDSSTVDVDEVGTLIVTCTPPAGAAGCRSAMDGTCRLAPTLTGLIVICGAVTVAVRLVPVLGVANPAGGVMLSRVLPAATDWKEMLLLTVLPPWKVALPTIVPTPGVAFVMGTVTDNPPRIIAVPDTTLPDESRRVGITDIATFPEPSTVEKLPRHLPVQPAKSPPESK